MPLATTADPREVRSYRRQADAACGARAATKGILAAWLITGEEAHDATLVVSELVGNAVRHSFGPVVIVTLTLCQTHLLVEVWDSATRVPHAASPGLDSETGRGLMLVKAVAVSAGGRTVAGGKIMWAEMRRSPEPCVS